jgi:hypothetical protein
MHLKNGRSARNGAYARKWTTSMMMVASQPKVSFWPDGSSNPWNYGWLFVSHSLLYNLCRWNVAIQLHKNLWERIDKCHFHGVGVIVGIRRNRTQVHYSSTDASTSEACSDAWHHIRADRYYSRAVWGWWWFMWSTASVWKGDNCHCGTCVLFNVDKNMSQEMWNRDRRRLHLDLKLCFFAWCC